MDSEQSTNNINNETKLSYYKAMQSTKSITRDQVILIDALVDATHEEYISALAEIVQASKIRFSSRIANNTRNKRIVFSNVHPLIDNSVIEEELEKINVKIMSRITSIQNGFSSRNLSLIISFRRQVYVAPEEITKIPSSKKKELNAI